jgi:hypothetical protein
VAKPPPGKMGWPASPMGWFGHPCHLKKRKKKKENSVDLNFKIKLKK